MEKFPEIKNKLTWERIHAMPKKRADMTVQEMREICVAFMRFSKTALWTPNAEVKFIKNASGTEDVMTPGNIYAGVPYISSATGNVFRMMDWIDEETGVLDLETAMRNPILFGNQCSGCTYWGGWGRVTNSTTRVWTGAMTQANGFYRVGPYTYPDDLDHYHPEYSTKIICEENGLDVMCQSYAKMQLADGFVNFFSGGHVLMASSEPHVEYADGKIDPEISYIHICEQGQKWHELQNDAGDTYQMKNSVDRKMTFQQLFNNSYIPFTYAEFLGLKGVDETEYGIDLTGDRITAAQLFGATVTSNYGISDIYVSFKDAQGSQVCRLVVRADVSGVRELPITREEKTFEALKGSFDDLRGDYSLEISAQLSTGERPVVYTGTITV